MEFTYQSTMQLPASYAVLSEDEMVYTVGGAFELNINAQDVLNLHRQCRLSIWYVCWVRLPSATPLPVSLTCGTMV